MASEAARAESATSCALFCVLIPISHLQVSEKFAFGLFDLDWDVFTQHIEGAINRVPVLEKTGIKSTVCGPGNAAVAAPWQPCSSKHLVGHPWLPHGWFGAVPPAPGGLAGSGPDPGVDLGTAGVGAGWK